MKKLKGRDTFVYVHTQIEKFMKRIIPIFIFGLIGVAAFGQQYPLFSNYILNGFGFNPGVAGSVDYLDARLTYRTQWVGQNDAPQTQIVSGHAKLQNLPIGIGGYFFNDEAGAIKRTGVTGVVSYCQMLGTNNRISFGIAGGYNNIRLRSGYRVENENDPFLAESMTGVGVPDFSAGVYFKNSGGLWLGASVPQILEQELTFKSSDLDSMENISGRLIRHYYLMGGYNIPVNQNIQVEPSVLVKMVNGSPVQYDISAVVHLMEKFWFGGSYRSEDAIAIMAGVDISSNFSLGYAYDMTTSQLKNYGTGSHEITLGIKFGHGKDSDGDGVPDRKDDCPDEPGPPENKGCPEEPIAENGDNPNDRDGDGILDAEDECPDVAGPPRLKGCPDSDGDGIADAKDNCPDVYGTVAGCPDKDGDGVADRDDKCPDQFGTAGGCLDSDGDGIADIDDACPNTAGVDGKSCPVVSVVEKEILNLAIINTYFDYDKDILRSEAFFHLDRLANLLVSKSDWNIELSGHADSDGTNEYNIDLSKRRAERVMYYLMNRGVRRDQLRVTYYGEEMPAAPNFTEGGKQLNRRVEMRFVFD